MNTCAHVTVKIPQGNDQQVKLKSASCRWMGLYRNQEGMYRFKQAGLLANQLLQKRLEPFGYYPSRHTPGMWLHKTRPISFSLIVEDFAVKYVGKENAERLRNALLRSYELTMGWCMTFKWDYKNRTCDSDTARLCNALKLSTSPEMKHLLSQQNNVSASRK
jgi:hypothetical protein